VGPHRHKLDLPHGAALDLVHHLVHRRRPEPFA
jgi:hypothetical protein